MKLLLKIHSKDRHYPTPQRKRKYFRRVSRSSGSSSSSASNSPASARNSTYAVSAAASAVARTGRNNQNRGLPPTEQSSVLRQERYFLYGALILFTIIAFSTALYFIVQQTQGNSIPSQPDILFGNNYASGTN